MSLDPVTIMARRKRRQSPQQGIGRIRHAVSGTTVTSNERGKVDFFGRKKTTIYPYDAYKRKTRTKGSDISSTPMWTVQRANLQFQGQKKFNVQRKKKHEKALYPTYSSRVPLPWLNRNPRITTKSLQHLAVRQVEEP